MIGYSVFTRHGLAELREMGEQAVLETTLASVSIDVRNLSRHRYIVVVHGRAGALATPVAVGRIAGVEVVSERAGPSGRRLVRHRIDAAAVDQTDSVRDELAGLDLVWGRNPLRVLPIVGSELDAATVPPPTVLTARLWQAIEQHCGGDGNRAAELIERTAQLVERGGELIQRR